MRSPRTPPANPTPLNTPNPSAPAADHCPFQGRATGFIPPDSRLCGQGYVFGYKLIQQNTRQNLPSLGLRICFRVETLFRGADGPRQTLNNLWVAATVKLWLESRGRGLNQQVVERVYRLLRAKLDTVEQLIHPPEALGRRFCSELTEGMGKPDLSRRYPRDPSDPREACQGLSVNEAYDYFQHRGDQLRRAFALAEGTALED